MLFSTISASHEELSDPLRTAGLRARHRPDLARRLPAGRDRIQLGAEGRRIEERCRFPDHGTGSYGLPAAAVARRQFHRHGTPLRRVGAVEFQRPSATRADRLRRRGRTCGLQTGRAGLRHRPLRRGIHAARCALCGRVYLLEPLRHGVVCRIHAPVCQHNPLAQGGRRPPFRRGLHCQGRRADDRRPSERSW